MELSIDQLTGIMTHVNRDKAAELLPFLNAALNEFEINTINRVAGFIGQISHESGELRFMGEVWGPTAQQKRYDPPDPLAARLGNTQAGDGFRYRGAGPIQITGRANFRKYGAMLGLDLEGHPELARTPANEFRLAAAFWKDHGLNELADAQDWVAITKRINGGVNGLDERIRYTKLALVVLQTEV